MSFLCNLCWNMINYEIINLKNIYFYVVYLKNILCQAIFRAVKSNYKQKNSGNINIFLETLIEWKNFPETHSELLFETPCSIVTYCNCCMMYDLWCMTYDIWSMTYELWPSDSSEYALKRKNLKKGWLREDFQSKKQRNLGIRHLGGHRKIKKVPSFSWE